MMSCEKCGKNNIDIRNLYEIDFIPPGSLVKDRYFVCQSCYNKILTYTLTRPIKKEEN